MSEAIVFESRACFSALGGLDHTVTSLIDGAGGIRNGPSFGVDVGCAPFADPALRDLGLCASRLGAGIDATTLAGRRLLFVYCAAKGDLRGLDQLADGSHTDDSPSALLDVQAEVVRCALGIEPLRTSVISNACASGAIALGLAAELLSYGAYDRAVVFGYDSLSRFVTTGFHALGALSPSVARPFDADRDGLTLGEGAAVGVLARREPQPGDIVLAGAASSNDANHRTGPSRTGEGLYRAAAAALRDAGVAPDTVGGVKCHGTATVYNDAMEAKALTTLFGSKYPPCVSLKGALGHTSGGGSLLETLLAAEFLKRRTLPPTAGFRQLGVDEPLPVSTAPQPLRDPSVLCLSAGFGGVNAALLLREEAA
ncbi:MAG: hypothetical protein GF331_23895 [Chitinivibrionales bacterium]|nr:hypothetical protein [Chitinivibrionales bacterium]